MRRVGAEPYEFSFERRSFQGGFAPLPVVSIGVIARRALAQSGATAAQLPGFSGSPWYQARGEIVWIGSRLPALHPRAVLTSIPLPRRTALRFGPIPRIGWSARLPRLDEAGHARTIDGARRLRRALVAAETPRGFGALLAGIAPSFPLDLAMQWVNALALAIECDDAEAAFQPARALLGLGAGLTPSGDDLVGGALFGRRLVSRGNARWTKLAQRLVGEIRLRSHAVSAALFADLAAGRSFAPLHQMADALAAGNREAALAAARTLVAIGHSSGWDMLAGFLSEPMALARPGSAKRAGYGFRFPPRGRGRCSTGL